jgi:hypothetical protein
MTAPLASRDDPQARYAQLLHGAVPPGIGQMSERDLQAIIERMCLVLGLRCYHPRDSRGSVPGWPDLVICPIARTDGFHGIVRNGKGVLYRELKIGKKRLSLDQEEWMRDLSAAGEDADVWRPEDLASGRILEELKALAAKPAQPQ